MTKEELLKKYPVGSRVRILKMGDVQAPPIGTLGTVKGVDDILSVMVSWDNGSGLNVVYGEDQIGLVDEIITICYGNRKKWNCKQEAIEFFVNCLLSSEGSEKERYETILSKIKDGLLICTDEK